MPILTDEKRIAELRERYPILTHTSWKPLEKIEPKPNVDKHNQDQGEIVCATSGVVARDFYALRCNEKKGMVNFSIPVGQTTIFIFEKIKDVYYEHQVSSKDFVPVVSNEGCFSGEWIAHHSVLPTNLKEGKTADVLRRTNAGVYTISNMEAFKEKLRDEHFRNSVANPKTALGAVNSLVKEGILKEEKKPSLNLMAFRSQIAGR